MSVFQDLKDLPERRLLAAVSRDLGEQRTTSGYEEELQRQRKLLDQILILAIKLHRAGVQLLKATKEELPPEQQERSPYPDQEENESPLIKEEQEEVWIGQRREQLQGLEEADTKVLFPSVHMKSENDEEEPESSLLHHRLTDHMETAAGGEDCGRPEPARSSDPERNLQPQIEVWAQTSSDTGLWTKDGADDWKETRDCIKSSNSATIKGEETVESHNCSEPGETNHVVSLAEQRQFFCSMCGKGFTRKTDLGRHMIVHTKEKPFSRPEPARSSDPEINLPSENEFQTDKSTNTGSGTEVWEDEWKDTKDWCKILNPATIRSEETVESHICPEPGETNRVVSLTEQRPFICSECGKGFTVEADLGRHMIVHKKGKGCFSCPECGKTLKHQKNLKSHMLVHLNEKPFSCSECGRRFSQRGSLTRHMVIHTNEKPFSCSECGKKFYQKGGLLRHMIIHSNDKPVSCPKCGKRFNNEQILARHVVIHTQKKPFSCFECGKRFVSKREVARHMVVHSKERPFCCSECGKGFKRIENLSSHMLVHTKEKPYRCTECGKGFYHKVRLRTHECSLMEDTSQLFECGVSFPLADFGASHGNPELGETSLATLNEAGSLCLEL